MTAHWCFDIKKGIYTHLNGRAGAWVVGLLMAAGCSQEPTVVYVLQAPQTVSLVASALSVSVAVDEPVVLSVQRETAGQWKQIPRAQLAPDQCWMARPPPGSEKEVADNLHWTVQPEGIARFNTDLRADRTRQVRFSTTGTFTLTASSSVWCEFGRSVAATGIRVEVKAK